MDTLKLKLIIIYAFVGIKLNTELSTVTKRLVCAMDEANEVRKTENLSPAGHVQSVGTKQQRMSAQRNILR
jgi:hypothetical protein